MSCYHHLISSYCGSRLLRKLLGLRIGSLNFGDSLILDHAFEGRFLKLEKVFPGVRTLEIWRESEATLASMSFLYTFTWALCKLLVSQILLSTNKISRFVEFLCIWTIL